MSAMPRTPGRPWDERALLDRGSWLTSLFILLEPLDCPDLMDDDWRFCVPGDIERIGTLGGGPGSAPGERRW